MAKGNLGFDSIKSEQQFAECVFRRIQDIQSGDAPFDIANMERPVTIDQMMQLFGTEVAAGFKSLEETDPEESVVAVGGQIAISRGALQENLKKKKKLKKSPEFIDFETEVKSTFKMMSDFEDLTGRGDHITHFKCDVVIASQQIELHLSNPYTDHWNCWPEPPMGQEKAVIGAGSVKEALSTIKVLLEKVEKK